MWFLHENFKPRAHSETVTFIFFGKKKREFLESSLKSNDRNKDITFHLGILAPRKEKNCLFTLDEALGGGGRGECDSSLLACPGRAH